MGTPLLLSKGQDKSVENKGVCKHYSSVASNTTSKVNFSQKPPRPKMHHVTISVPPRQKFSTCYYPCYMYNMQV